MSLFPSSFAISRANFRVFSTSSFVMGSVVLPLLLCAVLFFRWLHARLLESLRVARLGLCPLSGFQRVHDAPRAVTDNHAFQILDVDYVIF